MTDLNKIKKIAQLKNIKCRSVRMRVVEESDASFILSLRTDLSLSKYLSPVSQDINDQVNFIKQYKERELKGEELYYIISNYEDTAVGTVRIYNFKQSSFSWGSWIIAPSQPAKYAIEVAFAVYQIGFNILGFVSCNFEVNKKNESVWRFHERFGATKIDESDDSYIYKILPLAIISSKQKYGKYFSSIELTNAI